MVRVAFFNQPGGDTRWPEFSWLQECATRLVPSARLRSIPRKGPVPLLVPTKHAPGPSPVHMTLALEPPAVMLTARYW